MKEDVVVVFVLLGFVVLILTRRIIPWWVYERSWERLKQYQDNESKILKLITELLEIIDKKK